MNIESCLQRSTGWWVKFSSTGYTRHLFCSFRPLCSEASRRRRSRESSWSWTASIWSIVNLIAELGEKWQERTWSWGKKYFFRAHGAICDLKRFEVGESFCTSEKIQVVIHHLWLPLHTMGQPPVMCRVLPLVTSHQARQHKMQQAPSTSRDSAKSFHICYHL